MNVQYKKHHTNEEWAEFIKGSEDHRQYLIRSTGIVVKHKKPYGTEIILEFDPKHFLLPYDDVIEHWDISSGEAEITRYSVDAWFYPFCIVASTREKYHPAYKNLCPVLHNTSKNPITLKSHNGFLQSQYIHYLKTTRYKSGELMYEIYTTRVIKNPTGLSLIKGATYKLFVTKKGVHSLDLNGQPTTKATDFADMFEVLNNQFLYKKGNSLHRDYRVVQRLLDMHLPEWFGDRHLGSNNITISETMRERINLLENNPLLYDLPFTEMQLLNLFNENRFSYFEREAIARTFIENITNHLKHGDTKKAVDACYYGNAYPSSIKKLILKTDPLVFSKKTYDAISRCIECIGVDKTRIFITNKQDDTQLDFYILDHPKLLEAFSFGWNMGIIKELRLLPIDKKIRRLLQSKVHLVEDSINMHRSLLEKEVNLVLPSNNIKAIHDYLSPIYTLYSKAESTAEMVALKTVDTSDQLKPLITPDYVLRSPNTAAELMEVGTQMRHCVAAYAKQFFYRQIEIALLTDRAGEYLVCLEVYGNKVVQAKMKFNKPVFENEEYLKLVMDFIELNELKAACYDMGKSGGRYSYDYERREERDASRIAIVNALRQDPNNTRPIEESVPF